jgi:RNA polymerase sigma-70 factor (ECF subfamily)
MQGRIDEKLLVNEILSGNRKAFVRLVKQYEALVLHIVTPLIGVNENREDICQDVFIKVFENLPAFQFRSKLGTWIGNIAYNACINFLQKKRNVTLSDLITGYNSEPDGETWFDNTRDSEISPEDIVIKKEETGKLVKAIDRLPEIQRSILLLFHQDELSIEEISKVMEMPVNTVKSHLFRARLALKAFLSAK